MYERVTRLVAHARLSDTRGFVVREGEEARLEKGAGQRELVVDDAPEADADGKTQALEWVWARLTCGRRRHRDQGKRAQ